MRKVFSVLCVAIFLACSVCNVSDVYASAGVWAFMDYEMTESTDSGKVSVDIVAKVNDGTSTIVGYSIMAVEAKNGATNASVASSGIAAGGKQVYVMVNYSYAGTYRTETIYFGI